MIRLSHWGLPGTNTLAYFTLRKQVCLTLPADHPKSIPEAEHEEEEEEEACRATTTTTTTATTTSTAHRSGSRETHLDIQR
jgi:hypothetical protein